MNALQTTIEQAWENRALFQKETTTLAVKKFLNIIVHEI